MKVSKCSSMGNPEYPLSYTDILAAPGVYMMQGNITTTHIVIGLEGAADNISFVYYPCGGDGGRLGNDVWAKDDKRRFKRLEGASVCFEIRQKG